MMQLHLDEISRNVAEGVHAVLLLDRAGWHTTGKLNGKLNVPDNITPIFLPSRAPELNPVENVWQYLRQNWLSSTVFENYDAIIDAACEVWRKLIADPNRITSIGMRDWARVGQPLSPLVLYPLCFSEACKAGLTAAKIHSQPDPENAGTTAPRSRIFVTTTRSLCGAPSKLLSDAAVPLSLMRN